MFLEGLGLILGRLEHAGWVKFESGQDSRVLSNLLQMHLAKRLQAVPLVGSTPGNSSCGVEGFEVEDVRFTEV